MRANSTNQATLNSQFDGLDIKSPLEIRKPSPLISSGLEATNARLGKQRSTVGQDSASPFLGLQNRQFYTCFMNSILQCLVATPNFVAALTSLKQNP